MWRLRRSLQIKTKRLILRPMQMRDDRAWFASHCAVLPTKGSWEIPRRPVNELNFPEYMKFLNLQKSEIKSDLKYTLGVFHQETGTLLGYIYFQNISRTKTSHAELDFRILNIYWKKGFAKEAVSAALKLKKTLGLKTLEIAKKSVGKLKL